MPSPEQKLSTTLTNSHNDLRRDTSYGSDGRCSMVRKWRVGGRDHFWMFVVSLLSFSSLDLAPVQMASAGVFTTFGVNEVEVDFPRALLVLATVPYLEPRVL